MKLKALLQAIRDGSINPHSLLKNYVEPKPLVFTVGDRVKHVHSHKPHIIIEVRIRPDGTPAYDTNQGSDYRHHALELIAKATEDSLKLGARSK